MESKNIFKRCSGLLFLITVVCACDPAEEGKPYELIYTMPKVPSDTTMVMWTKDDIFVTECPLFPGDCVINDLSWLTAKVEKKGDTLQFSIYINSVSRGLLSNAKGFWKLRRHTSDTRVDVFYYCNLQVYAKPAEINCKKTLSKDGLTVSCYGKQVYPEAMMSIIRKPEATQTISCKNTLITREPVYYNSQCVRTFQMHELHLIRDDFTFFIYPSMIGIQNNNQIGTNVSMILITEPNSVSVEDCNTTTSSINCSCERLDKDDSKSGFNWYVNGVEVKQKSQYYETTMSSNAVHKIICKPVVNESLRCLEADKSAVATLAILFVVAFVIILILCYKYTKLCKSFKNFSQTTLAKIKNRKRNDTTKSAENQRLAAFQEETTDSKTGRKDSTHSQLSAKNSDEDNKENRKDGIGSIAAGNSKDDDTLAIKTVLLLMGTKNSYQDIVKEGIVYGKVPFNIKATYDEKHGLRSQKKTKFVSKKKDENIVQPKIDDAGCLAEENQPTTLERDPSHQTINLTKDKTSNAFSSPQTSLTIDYISFKDRVIKLVTIPHFHHDEKEFVENVKAALVLSPCGYTAFLLVFTSSKSKNAKRMLDILKDGFDVDMNYVYPVLTFYKDLVIRSKHMAEYNSVKGICTYRSYLYDILSSRGQNISSIFSDGNQPLFLRYLHFDKEKAGLLHEEIVKDLFLFLQKVNENDKNNLEKDVEHLNHVQKCWDEYILQLDKTNTANLNIETDISKEKTNRGSKYMQTLIIKVSEEIPMPELLRDNITHILEFLHHVHLVEQPMKKMKEMLLPDLRRCYELLRVWYVRAVICFREDVLDSNIRLKISQMKLKN